MVRQTMLRLVGVVAVLVAAVVWVDTRQSIRTTGVAVPRQQVSVAESVCHLHQRSLVPDTVLIQYGYIGMPLDERRTMPTRFPNAFDVVYGGCLVDADRPETMSVSFCPECRVAKAQWQEESGHQ